MLCPPVSSNMLPEVLPGSREEQRIFVNFFWVGKGLLLGDLHALYLILTPLCFVF